MGHVDVATRQAAQGCGVIIIKAAVIEKTLNFLQNGSLLN